MHLGSELRVSIEDQVLVVRAFGECFANLLHGPFTGRVLGHIKVDDLSANRAESGISSTESGSLP
jgi:hypothetical protein